MSGKRFSESKSRKNGFYLALAVCLTAVGIAAWSTYDAVQSYVDTAQTASELQEQKNIDVRESAKPTSTSKAKSTAAPAPTQKPSETKTTQAAAPTVSPAASPTPSPAAEEPETEEQTPVNAPLYERSAQMVAPIRSGSVCKAYSSGAPVYSETMKDWRVHAGADYTAESGEDVWACANGKVLQTYTDSMLGNVILIEHGDYQVSYCGVSENFQVSVGDIVTKGQVIGTVTAVPFESAEDAHLHVEVRLDGGYIDPESLFADEE